MGFFARINFTWCRIFHRNYTDIYGDCWLCGMHADGTRFKLYNNL